MLLWQHLLPCTVEKLVSSNLCWGLECKEEPTKIFYIGRRNRKSVAMATLVARYCRKNNQLQAVQSYGMQSTHQIIYKFKKQKKSVAMPTLVARYCQKTSQLQSVQWFGMQRSHKNVYILVQEKDKVLPWQNLLPGIAEKVISSNQYTGLECKEPTKRFLNPRNMRKCCQVPTKSQFEKQYRKSITMATAVTKTLQKSNITTFVVPLAKNIS